MRWTKPKSKLTASAALLCMILASPIFGQSNGVVEITTEPAELEVSLDNINLGPSPIVAELVAGTYSLFVESVEYGYALFDITIEASDTTEIYVNLIDPVGTIDVRADVEGQVFIADSLLGAIPLRKLMDPGIYQLTARSNCYLPAYKEARVEANSIINWRPTFKAQLQAMDSEGGFVSGIDVCQEGTEVKVQYDLAPETDGPVAVRAILRGTDSKKVGATFSGDVGSNVVPGQSREMLVTIPSDIPESEVLTLEIQVRESVERSYFLQRTVSGAAMVGAGVAVGFLMFR